MNQFQFDGVGYDTKWKKATVKRLREIVNQTRSKKVPDEYSVFLESSNVDTADVQLSDKKVIVVDGAVLYSVPAATFGGAVDGVPYER